VASTYNRGSYDSRYMGQYLPFQRGKWKRSTQGTSENRIRHHILAELGDTALKDSR
jgi:hypothetical protein